MRRDKSSFWSRPLAMLLCIMMLFSMMPTDVAAKTDDSDAAENIFVYVEDVSGEHVLLKAIPLEDLQAISYGQDETKDTTFYGSFIDSYPTPTYLEGRGLTIPDFMDYVFENTSVENADRLSVEGNDRLYFTPTDSETASNVYAKNLEGRYYFPELYNYWDVDDAEISDVEAVLASKIPMPAYLATESAGGRIFARAGGGNIADKVVENGGIVTGSLKNHLGTSESIRLVLPQTESDIEEGNPTFGTIKKWVYKVRLKPAGSSPVTSLGTVADPECRFTLNEGRLTITMKSADPEASIYYSAVGGLTQAPVKLYTDPIVIDNYNADRPFHISLQAVREGYVSSKVVKFNSSNISENEDDPGFTYAMNANGTPQVSEPFTISASLTADADAKLYGTEYRVTVPGEYFTVDSVQVNGDGWSYGAVDQNGDTVVTFTYLDINGARSLYANQGTTFGTINLIPKKAGEASIDVAEAIVTNSNASPYQTVTASGLSLTIGENGGGQDNQSYNADTSWYNTTDTAFYLKTAEELAGLAKIANGVAADCHGEPIAFDDFTGKVIYLDSDIYLNDHLSTGQDDTARLWEPIGWGYYIDQKMSTPFNGTFDGQGHTVYNMYQWYDSTRGGMSQYEARGNALIGYTAEAAVIKNLTVTGYAYGNRYVAGIVGKVGTKGAAFSAEVGPGTVVENCINYTQVTSTGARGSGGVVGAAWNRAVVRHCVNYGDVLGIGSDGGKPVVGGVVGETEYTVDNCVNYGRVEASGTTAKFNAGGVVGNMQSPQSVAHSCVNYGEVVGGNAGGIVGYTEGGAVSLTNSYSLGKVSGAVSSGGVVGEAKTSSQLYHLYYLEGQADAAIGKSAPADHITGEFQLKDQTSANYVTPEEFLNKVNGVGTVHERQAFVADANGVNDGYPLLTWQQDAPGPVPASDYTVSLNIAENHLNVGETFDVEVKVAGEDLFASFQARVSYDKDLLTFIGAEGLDDGVNVNASNGIVTILRVGQNISIDPSGSTVAKLSFKLKPTAETGSHQAAFSVGDAFVGKQKEVHADDPRAAVGAPQNVTLHNLAVTFTGGEYAVLEGSAVAYVRYDQGGLYTSNDYTSAYVIPTPVANSGYHLADQPWKDEEKSYLPGEIESKQFTQNAVFTANVMMSAYEISFFPSDFAEEVTGVTEGKVVNGTDITFKLKDSLIESGYAAKVSYKVGNGSPQELTAENGVYKIAGNAVIGNIEVTLAVVIAGEVEFISSEDYNAAPMGYQVMLFKPATEVPGAKYCFDSTESNMFWSSKYERYVYFVKDEETQNSVLAKMNIVYSGENQAIQYGGDVNGSSSVNVYDAQIVYDLYADRANANGIRYLADHEFNTLSMLIRLEADVNGDKTVDIQDVRIIGDLILNKLTSEAVSLQRN